MRRGRSFSELGWPPPVQPANSRTRRVNCTTTYVPRRRRNAAAAAATTITMTMMMMIPSSHEITRDTSLHDIPLAEVCAQSLSCALAGGGRGGGRTTLYWINPCARECESCHSFTCVQPVCRRRLPNLLLFCCHSHWSIVSCKFWRIESRKNLLYRICIARF